MFRDVSSNVSVFVHPWKHCCGNKICFPGSKNVSYQIQKHFMFLKCDFCCGNIVSQCLPTLGNMAKHWQETMFPQQCFLVCPGLKCLRGDFLQIRETDAQNYHDALRKIRFLQKLLRTILNLLFFGGL